MKLSSSLLTAAQKGKASIPAGRHCDENNLYLQVTPTGAMSWVFIYTSPIYRYETGKLAGKFKRCEMGLGSLTGQNSAVKLSLADARRKADEVRVLLRDGKDPLGEKGRTVIARTTTFAEMLDQLLKVAKPGWKAKGADRMERHWKASMETHCGSLMKLPVATITAAEVEAVVLKQDAQGRTFYHTNMGGVVARRIEAVLKRAKELGMRQDNPASKDALKSLIGKAKRKTIARAAMDGEDVPAFVATLMAEGSTQAKALAFIILNATRSTEGREARWEEIDFDAKTWTIPAERMKEEVEHVVPLSTQALALLRSMPRIVGNPYVFASSKLHGEAVGETTFRDLLRKLELAGKITTHGFRSSFCDYIGENHESFVREDREMALAHKLDAVEGAYRRKKAVARRRPMMQTWADHVMPALTLVKVAA